MRIAIFSEVYWPMVSGVSMTLTRTADALLRRGHQVRVYSATYPLPDGTRDRPEVHRSPSRPLFLSPEVQWGAPDADAISDDLGRFQPDVVHIATEWAMGHAGLRAARALGIPIVASAHTDYERYASRYRMQWAVGLGWHYLRWFYGHAQVVLAPTEIYRAHLHSRGVPHTGLWTRGVDTAQFAPAARSAEYRAGLGIAPDEPIVAYVGRIAPEKGIPTLLDAWDVVSRLHERAHLVFTGDGRMETEIRRRKLPRVHLTGVLRGAALTAAYASADVFAMPSTTETFGNVTLEAMASGVATVAVAAGGVLEFGVDGDNVLLASPDDPAAFPMALDRLLADDRLRRRLGTGGRETALQRDWGPVFSGLFDWYQTTAEQRSAAQAA